ncbi:CocE/NonD family hydrolase [Rhodococcus sp. NBC_00294]|uniref:CocE/NonD family hydrolase n=1 Tax=Rhodococcus sp. NBC_00294 TaxID=2976004 RepID=UPI002E298BC4|nr:CocE/NonD family hydrolase [Rhodococcus sp. NBC_00294]
MRDGTVLTADVYRPVGDGPWPVLVQRTPYGKQTPISNANVLDFYKTLRRGYIIVNQDTRGRFTSMGKWMPWEYEGDDGYDTIEWAATIDGSNGMVGMFGASYTGNTQWAAAVTRPPHLRAIAPQITWSAPEDGIFYRGGALEFGLNVWWTLGQSMGQFAKEVAGDDELASLLANTFDDLDHLADRTYWELPSAAVPAIARTGQPDVGTQRGLIDPSSLRHARVAGRYSEVSVPSLNVAGWFDVFSQGTIDNHLGTRAAGLESRLIIGPWEHMSGITVTPGHINGINYGLGSVAPGGDGTMTGVQLDWFDHYLAGGPKGPSHESAVDYYVMGVDEWRREDHWPPERAEATRFYLHSDGTLSRTAPTDDRSVSEYDYDPAKPAPTSGGSTTIASSFPAGQVNQSSVEQRGDVLTFTSAPLTEPLEITGRVTATIHAATDGPSTDWVVRLCDVDEDGVSLNIVDGITRVHTTAGHVDGTDVDLWSTSIVLAVGHRLRVQVTSSNFPRWDRNPNTGEDPKTATQMRVAHQTVHHDRVRASCIVLPVISSF